MSSAAAGQGAEKKYFILRWLCCWAAIALPSACHGLSRVEQQPVDALSPPAKGLDGIGTASVAHWPSPDDSPYGDQRKILSRRKRFLAFPLGSSFSTAVCMTTGVIGNPNTAYLSMGLNWGIAYELPNATWVLDQTHGFGHLKNGEASSVPAGNEDKLMETVAVPTIKRRHRRDLYGKLETLIDSMGYNGRDCVLRALCESRQYFQRTKMTMVGEMLRAVFSLPKQRLFTRELRDNEDIVVYDRAYRKARSTDCQQEYDCKFSLLELAFGKYSQPPAGYYGNH